MTSVVVTQTTINASVLQESTSVSVTSSPINVTISPVDINSHSSVTIGTANGLSLSGQVLSLGLSSALATGALSSADWSTFNNKQAALGYTPVNIASADWIDLTDGGATSLHSHAGGGGTWGSITGTLSDQTDLQAALDAKQDDLTFPIASTLGGTGVNNAGTLTNASNTAITGGGTVALGGFTLTVPATGTVDLLGTAQTITAAKTINVNSTAALLVEQDGVKDNTFVVDTTNGRVYIGNTTGLDTLTIGTPETGILSPSAGAHVVGVFSANGAYYRGRDTALDLEFVMGSSAAVYSYSGSLSEHPYHLIAGGGASPNLWLSITATGMVGINASVPVARLEVRSTNPFSGTSIASSSPASIPTASILTTTAQAADVGPVLALGGSRGGTGIGIFAGIRGAKENATDSNASGYLGFYTTEGGVAFAERGRISSVGLWTMYRGAFIDLSSDVIGLRVQAHSTQTANLQTWENSSSVVVASMSGTGALSLTDAQSIAVADALTSTAATLLTLDHTTSGTAAVGFGSQILFRLESSTGTLRNAGAVTAEWSVATDATRAGLMRLGVDSAGVMGFPFSMTKTGLTFNATGGSNGDVILGVDDGGTSWFRITKGTGAIVFNAGSSATNTAPNLFSLIHNTSGTPAAGLGSTIRYQAESSTTNSRDQAFISASWVDVTDASRTARLTLSVADTATREAIRIEASGTAAMLGFYGVAAVARATTGIAEAAFTENAGGTAVNVDSTFGGYTLQQIVQALQSIGVLT